MSIRKLFIPFLLSISVLNSCDSDRSKPDDKYDISVADPKLTLVKPVVYFDASHKNHHEIDNTFRPFAQLITNDGCVVKANKKPIDENILAAADIYVIATAMGWEDPGEVSPFTSREVDDLERWVDQGGSALIITEHYPFGLAMKPLLDKFGITVHNGYTEDTLLNNAAVGDALLFEKSKGNLNSEHPILNDVDRINTFTGASVKGDSTFIPLLIFTNNAQNYNVKVVVERNGNDITTNVTYADFYSAAGYAQGLSKSYGKGKIIVLAESAFLTAQIDKNGNKFGMNIPDTRNKQFALNCIRWLAEKVQ